MRKFLFVLIVSFATGCTGLVFKTPSASMSPAVKPGDSVSVDPVFYKLGGLQRFDIVVVKDPEGKKHSSGRAEMYIERVIALGGEKFETRGRKFFINDRAIQIPFAIEEAELIEDFGPFVVPQGEYFVMGDNVGNSLDSRTWNPATIKAEGVHGKVTLIKDGATGEMRDP